MTTRLAATLLGALLLAPPTSSAAPMPVINLTDLVSRSDAIVAGRAVAIQELGPGAIATPNGGIRGTRVSVEVVTERSLKGDLSGPFQVELVHTDIPSGYGTLPLRIPQVFFVRRVEGRWVVTDLHYPSLPAGAGEAEGATALDRVISVIGSALLDQTGARSARIWAMEALGSVALPASRKVLQVATGDRQPEIRYRSIAKLLSMGDLAFLPAVEEALLQGQLDPDVAVTLRGSIFTGVRDPVAVPSLARLLRAGDVDTRRMASFVLSKIPPPATVPVLRSALDDADFEVRFNGARGLAWFLRRSDLVPTEAELRADESRFIPPLKALIPER